MKKVSLFIALGFLLTTSFSFSQGYQYYASFGSSGSGKGQFSGPISVVVDKFGKIYVADGSNRIQVFTGSGTNYSYVDSYGSTGTLPGQFYNISAMYSDTLTNRIYVSESGSYNDGAPNRIQVLTTDGVSIGYFTDFVSSNWALGQPNLGIYVDRKGYIYQYNDHTASIDMYTLVGQNFQLKKSINFTGQYQFSKSYGITMDSQDRLYVTNWWSNPNAKFAVYSTDGFNFGGMYSSTLNDNPASLFITKDDIVFIAGEPIKMGRIRNNQFEVLADFCSTDPNVSGRGLWVDKNDVVYVTNFSSNVVNVYKKGAVTSEPTPQESASSSISISPNPGKDVIYLKGIDAVENISIISMNGNVLKEWENNPTGGITIDFLKPGMYQMVIKSTGKTIHRKFIKED